MVISTPTVSPLRQRMLDGMRMRKMAEHTQDGYVRAVRKLAAFLGRSPDTASIEELRRLPASPGGRRRRAGDDHRHDHGAEVRLRHHPGPARAIGQDAACTRAAHLASGLEPRANRTLDRRSTQPQTSGSDVGRVWRGLARQ